MTLLRNPIIGSIRWWLIWRKMTPQSKTQLRITEKKMNAALQHFSLKP